MKTIRSILFPLLFLGAGIIACQPSDAPGPDNIPDLSPLQSLEVFAVQEANEFSFRLWNQAIKAKKPEENLFISPFSVSMALSMAANGASQDLRPDFAALLGMGNVQEANMAYQLLMERLPRMDKKVTMNIANSIWYKEQMRVRTPIKEDLRRYYSAEIFPANFAHQGTVNQINNWVNTATNGKIPSILDEIREEHVMFLINALYFKADWTIPFRKEDTAPREFELRDGTKVQVSMMKNTKAKYLYQMHPDFELIDLPYGNGQYRMTVLMPAAGRSFDSFLETWTFATLNNHLQKAPEIGYDLYFPKMKMESELNLKPILANMGLDAAFNMSKGGFSAFFHDDGEFIITDVKHKTFLEVDEKGTEAAAVTAIGVGVTSLPPSVWVNRPFYFFIREQHTDALLFMGRCMNPLEM